MKSVKQASTPKLNTFQRIKIYFKKFKTFIYKHIRFALLISLIGGVPGLINVWNWTHQNPEFVFHTETITYGDFSSIPNSKIMTGKYYLISGAIYNSGNEPFSHIFLK
ncbi:MAG: hypothetical protein Q8891_11720 [Bacteroidota bacterium]|nr:hypothetical protein [Bacteroidota bacterium]